MKVLITGASGFVGRNVKEYLEKKEYCVYSPSSKELDCINENSVKEYLEYNNFDIVLNFAVYGDGIDKQKDGTKILEYNLRIFQNFYKCSTLYGRMIYTGSGAEFDKRYPIIDIKETAIDRTIPVDQYGLMKYTVQQMINSSENIYNLRLFGIFGKYEDWKTKYISNICCKAICGLPLSIRKNCIFDYIWIEDFCKMLEKFILLKNPKYHDYNAVSGKKVELYDLAQIVSSYVGELPVYVCREGYANEYTADNTRILEEIGDFSYTDINYSVKELFNWYNERKDKIDIMSLIYGD